MEKPKIESESFLMGKTVMPDNYPFPSPAFREDTLEQVLVSGQTYEFELVRIRNQNYVDAFKIFKAENTILAGAQGFALLCLVILLTL